MTTDMSPPHIAGILATSRMIALVEDTCLEMVQPLLAETETTVGTHVDLTHVGPARVGDSVTVQVRLVTVTRGRLLRFEVQVTAPGGVIGTGTHQRLVVDRSKVAPEGAPAVTAGRPGS